ncbi:MAG: FtsW/RodA/SpoVE family cell cycle protein [Planctomycetales bacterium]
MPVDHSRHLFLSLAAVLAGFGALMVHSASVTSWPTEAEQVYLSRHLVFLALGIATGGISAVLPAEFWRKAAPWLFAATLLLLVAVLVPGVGTEVNGARRWLRYGPLSLQPCELAKITLPLLLARLLASRFRRLDGTFGCGKSRSLTGGVAVRNELACEEGSGTAGPPRGAYAPRAPALFLVWPILLIVPLVAVQPDLGSALFIAGGGAIGLFAGGWPLRNFVFASLAAVPACWALLVVRPYQMNRIKGFLAAWADWNDAPYQLKQSLMTLAAGGTWGVGLGRGWQKLSFLPEANTDFVVAVVGEELGLVGTLGLAAVWVALYFSGLRLLGRLGRTSFEWIAGFTLLTQLVLQAALNVAVVTAMVPPKGIPHPLISYGGSNLVVSLAAIGIVVSLSRGER